VTAIVVLCAVPSDFDAESLATTLVERSLAACVQIGPRVTSIYRWKGSVDKSEERLLIIKTRRECFEGLESAIRAAHPYEVPEIIALDIAAGHAPYLAWLAEATAR
jgi:periplasmic divalent cation tolerance protein